MSKPKSVEDILSVPATKELAAALRDQKEYRKKKSFTWDEMAEQGLSR